MKFIHGISAESYTLLFVLLHTSRTSLVIGNTYGPSLSRARIQQNEGNDDVLMFPPRTNLLSEEDDFGIDQALHIPSGISTPKDVVLTHPEAELPMFDSKEWQATGSITKTGTTIVGIRTKDAVVLAADTRATEGSLVADTTCEKLQPLSNYAAAAGAGTAADLYHVTRACRYSGKLMMISTDESTVSLEYLCRFLQSNLYRGDNEVYLIIGGFLKDGSPCLREIHPHGSMNDAAFTALGSGGMAALSVLEHDYKPSLSLEQAVDLAVTAVKAGIQHDMGSGSQVDVCILRPNQPASFSRAVVPAEELPEMKFGPMDQPMLNESSDIVIPRGGVNGFGNSDLVIRSRKRLCWNENKRKEQTLDEWKDVLY